MPCSELQYSTWADATTWEVDIQEFGARVPTRVRTTHLTCTYGVGSKRPFWTRATKMRL
jgi:hypothetical protein